MHTYLVFVVPDSNLHIALCVKGADMALIPFPDYIRRADELLLRGASPLYVRRQVFVSTEDPLVIQQASDGPGAMLGSWAAVYYDLPRVNDGAMKQIAAIRGTMSAGRLARLHLLQVRIAPDLDLTGRATTCVRVLLFARPHCSS